MKLNERGVESKASPDERVLERDAHSDSVSFEKLKQSKKPRQSYVELAKERRSFDFADYRVTLSLSLLSETRESQVS